MSTPRDTNYSDYLAEALKTPEEAANYLTAVIELNDQGASLQALRQVASAHGMAEVARRAEVGDNTLFKVLSDTGNPTLATTTKLLNAMGLRLTVEAIPA